MNFNFNELAETSFVSQSQNYLKPFDIYKVRLTKIEKSTVGKKDGSTSYPVVALEFTDENEGIFSENLFIPDINNAQDFENKENETSHKLMPSRFQQFQYTLMQIVEAINPTGAQNIKANGSKLEKASNPVIAFVDLVIKALTGKNTEVYLKLIGRTTADGATYARLPNACLMGQNGKPSALNFINADKGKLFFSAYEMQQANKYKNAKPTKMPDNPDATDAAADDLNIDDIEV